VPSKAYQIAHSELAGNSGGSLNFLKPFGTFRLLFKFRPGGTTIGKFLIFRLEIPDIGA